MIRTVVRGLRLDDGSWQPGRHEVRNDEGAPPSGGTPSWVVLVYRWFWSIGGSGQIARTFSACGPFGPWVTSNSTRWFSSSER